MKGGLNHEELDAAARLLRLLSSEEGAPASKLRKATKESVLQAISLLAAEFRHASLPSSCEQCHTDFTEDAVACKKCGTKRVAPASLQGLWRGAVKAKPFDEMRDEKGKVRTAYAHVVPIVEKILKSKPKRINAFAEDSLKGFHGDCKMYHIPRMLTAQETDLLVKGISQRARALRRLILDVNSRSVMRVSQLDCVKNKALPEAVFQRIAARAGERWAQSLVHANGDSKAPRAAKLYWSMWYGPDIIRGPTEDGGWTWYVVEDNLGYVGGFGDLALARQILVGENSNGGGGFPEFKSAIRNDVTEKLYDDMAAHYKSQVADGEQVVILYYPRSIRDDNEDRRVLQLFKRRGIIPVQLPEEGGPRDDIPRLVVRNGKVLLSTPAKVDTAPKQPSDKKKHDKNEGARGRSRSPNRRSPAKERKPATKNEPVGLVVFLSEPTDVEPGHESTKLRTAIDEARSRITDYEATVKKEMLKSTRAEKSIVSVVEKVEFQDTLGNKHVLQMKGSKLAWTISIKESKETERHNGPIRWNESTGKLTTSENNSYKPEQEGSKLLEKHWKLSDLPINAVLAQNQVSDLKNAVEAVGQLVGGRVNTNAREELFRILRRDDKESWGRLMQGKQGVPGLLEAYYAGGVKVANGPGLIHVEDKELCSYVDGLIRFYLNEEPILRTIPTCSFATDDGLVAAVFDDPRAQADVVVKRVDGRGGNAVWVGAKLPREEFMAVRALVMAEPEAFLVQKYTALSQVDGQLVDLRGPAFISSVNDDLGGGPGVAVSPVLWGRGVPAEGSNGKVNISDKGFEFAVATAAE